MAHQLTIFLENRPGRIQSISKVLVENNMNIWAFTIQDRGEFGLIRMVVDKPKQAQLVLADLGVACAMKEVLAVTAADAPGNPIVHRPHQWFALNHFRGRDLLTCPGTKAALGHPQRPEDLRSRQLIQRLPRYLLDEVAQQDKA